MNKEEIQNLVCEELVKHIASLLEKGLIRAEQVQELAPMIEKAMNVRLAEKNQNEEIKKKSNESVAKQESMSDEQFYEAYNSMLRVIAGEDGTEHNMVDITEIADEMKRRGITNEQLNHDIANYREKAKKKSDKATEKAQEKENKTVIQQESMSDEQFYEDYNSLLKAVAGVDGTENNMVDLIEGLAEEMERRGITNEQLNHDIAKYREEAKKKSDKAAEKPQEKENKTIIQQESMSDEQFYEAYNSMLRVVAGEDGTEHNMVDITEIADEMERRGITNEQLNHDIAKYREAKIKSGKAAEIAQLSDAELIKKINDFREALQKGNYVTVTNPETIKLLQNEAKNRGLIGEKENNYSKREETQNPQSFEQNKGKIDITYIVRTGLQSAQIGNEEVKQALNSLSKGTQEKDRGEK